MTRSLPVLCAAIALLLPLGAVAAGQPQLSPRDVAQFRDLVGDKPSRTPAEQKLDSNLLLAMRALAQPPGTPVPAYVQSFVDRNVTAAQTVFVVVKATVSADLVAFLRSLGAQGLAEFPDYETVTAYVPVGALLAIAERAEVKSIGPREFVMTQRYLPTAEERAKQLKALADVVTNVGTVTWQGVTAHQADKAAATGITGAGVKVCVLSDGIDSLAGRQASGDLPASITVLPGQSGSGDEGTAMLEIVNDMAPGASLGYATAVNGSAQFATNIVNLRTMASCDVIVDDVSYLDEGAFQDGSIARAVNTVTAAGALYFSAAANSGNVTHGSSGTFEGDFVPSASSLPAALLGYEGPFAILHSFGALPYTTLTAATDIVSLKWSDPLGASGNDYDVVVMDSTGTNILCNPGVNGQTGTQDPVDFAYCDFGSFPVGSRIYIVKYSGATRALRLDTNRGRIPNGTTGSTYGHNAAASALTVAAVRVTLAGGGPFIGGGANPVEFYSSDGPRRMFYSPTGVQLTPGNILFATGGGTLLPKVDIAAADCGSTTTPGFTPFCGTSAAAPTAAAIAALVKSAKPSASASEVTTAVVFGTLDIEASGRDRDSGFGIVMAPAAVRGVLLPLTSGKSFVPATIAPGATAVLTIAVTNPNLVALSGIAFSDVYPSLVTNGASPNLLVTGSGCLATLAATAGGGSLVVAAATIPAMSTCTFRVTVTATVNGSYTDASGPITTPIGLNTPAQMATLSIVTPVFPPGTNVALASNGGVASASSVLGAGFPASAVIDGDRAGRNWGSGSGWNDATNGVYPDWVQVNFPATQTIDKVVVYTLQDAYSAPSEPTDTMTFSLYGITDFTVQGWNGSSWVILGTVTGNTLVKRTVTFAAFTTDRVRINITNGRGVYSHVTEIEAFTVGSGPHTNVALASNGGVASASSVLGAGFPASAVINGDRAGLNWGSGSGWNDATPGAYPDWVQVNFTAPRAIDRVVVYTLQDAYASPVEPTDTMTFSLYGITDFTVQGWNGSSWVTLGTVTGNSLVKRTVTFAAYATDRIRINITNGRGVYSHVTEIEAWAQGTFAPPGPSTNVALASAGGVASASSVYGPQLPASAVNDGNRAGFNWMNGSGWNDATAGVYPDWVQVNFAGAQTIDHVVVYTLQDAYAAPVEPTDAMTFSLYGITDFTVQGWDGSSWVILGTVTGNNLVKRTVTFAAYTTDRIRINITNGRGVYSHVTELEAWTVGTAPPPVETNVALASAGGVASASSVYGPQLPASAVNDGNRAGFNWMNGSGWNDATPGVYPDWVQVNFGGAKTIDRVVVYTLQDAYAAPVEPTDTMTFSLYGITDFTVEGWNGSAWVVLGTVAGNNLVKRTVTFAPFGTDRVRVNISNGRGVYSHVTEIEAWGN